MRKLILATIFLSVPAIAEQNQKMHNNMPECEMEINTYCIGMESQQETVIECLTENMDNLSPVCLEKVKNKKQMMMMESK